MRSVTTGWPARSPTRVRGVRQRPPRTRSISDQVALGSFGAAGWSALTADLVALSERIRDERPGLPLFLLGHSMGSFALQEVIIDHSDLYRGVVLSGSTALDVTAAGLGDSAAVRI
jgi:alpha-beta hydrolase superfamily lysophospholipase